MASMFGNEDHRHDFDESPGATVIVDKVGSKDLAVHGNVEFFPDDGYVRLNGIDAALKWTTQAGGSGQRLFASQDVSEYREFVWREPDGLGVSKNVHASTSSPGGPFMLWRGATEAFRTSIDQDQIDSRVDFALPPSSRLPILGERFFYAFSWTFATGVWAQILISDRGVNLSDTGTTTGISQDRAWYIGVDVGLSNFSELDIYRYGIGNGQIYTVSELQADANSVIVQKTTAQGGSLYKDSGLYIS